MRRPAAIHFGRSPLPAAGRPVEGRFAEVLGDEFYVIDDAQGMPPFLMSVVSDSDHWLFVESNGGLTAGRKNPAIALFPYVTEDKLVDAAGLTGPVTSLLVTRGGRRSLWHPLPGVGPARLPGHPPPLQERPREPARLRGDQPGPGGHLPRRVDHERRLRLRPRMRGRERRADPGRGARPRRTAEPPARQRGRAPAGGLQLPARRLQAERARPRHLARPLLPAGPAGRPGRAERVAAGHHRVEPRARDAGPPPLGVAARLLRRRPAGTGGGRGARAARGLPRGGRASPSPRAPRAPGPWWRTWTAPSGRSSSFARGSAGRPGCSASSATTWPPGGTTC